MRMQSLLRVVYPPQCLACDTRVLTENGLCGKCWGQVPWHHGLCCDRCAESLPGESDRAELCDDCLVQPPAWRHARAVFDYGELGRDLVLRLKHGDRTELAGPLGRWMADKAQDFAGPRSVVVPVPLHWWRLARRRYNQSGLLGRAMARQLGCGFAPTALRRPRATPSLQGKTAAARAEILTGAIRIADARAVQGRSVLLVDDVYTTGATLRACTEALMQAGAEQVDVVVLARANKDA